MSLAYRCRCTVSGTSTMIRSAQAQASSRLVTASPGRRGGGRPLGALGQPDPDLAARVVQGQGVGVALGAIAEHGDLAGLDEAEVGVVVVVDRGHCSECLLRWSRLRQAGRATRSGLSRMPLPPQAGATQPVRASSRMP